MDSSIITSERARKPWKRKILLLKHLLHEPLCLVNRIAPENMFHHRKNPKRLVCLDRISTSVNASLRSRYRYFAAYPLCQEKGSEKTIAATFARKIIPIEGFTLREWSRFCSCESTSLQKRF